MIRSQVTKSRSVYFTIGDIFDNLNECQRGYLRHVLQCKHDLSDVLMMVTSDGRLDVFGVTMIYQLRKRRIMSRRNLERV